MDGNRTEGIEAAISWGEAHLGEKLDLDALAGAAGYSKFHLHRMFTDTVGMTPHGYIRRRRLTEAARALVFSRTPVIEIALAAGYESQQAFAAAFKLMYKRTPAEYRRNGTFYPLQLAFTPDRAPELPAAAAREVSCAELSDIPGWMDFVPRVIGGFPCFDGEAHLERLRRAVRRRQALVMRHGGAVIAAAAFSRRTGHISFLAVDPQYRSCGAARALLNGIARESPPDRGLSITTFRRGDRADPGQREAYRRLGFAEAELLTEFGYPVQRLILTKKRNGHG